MGLRLQPQLGTRLLGPAPAGDRIRRRHLDASVENYDNVLVTLLGDVATNYVPYRTTEQRIKYAKENVALQRKTLQIVEGQLKAGIVGELDVEQARSTLEQTEAGIPGAGNRPAAGRQPAVHPAGHSPPGPEARLGQGRFPRRRRKWPSASRPTCSAAGPTSAGPSGRRPPRARRSASPRPILSGLSINGTIGYAAQNFNDLFREQALTGNVGPSFTWNILNYGRIVNNVRLQDASFQELVATYQNTVLSANQDVENGLVQFLRAQRRAKSQRPA